MNLDQLETFLAVARSGSFTKAAPMVHRTQSGVSRQIQELEKSLGAPLFERLGKQITLTHSGRMLLEEAPPLLQQADNLRERFREISQGVCGELRIGATISAANTFIPNVLAQFRKRHPAVGIGLVPGQTASLTTKLRRNEVDVAILGCEPEDPDLEVCYRIPDELVLLASTDHPVTTNETRSAKKLEGVDFIHREHGSDTRDTVEQWFEDNRVTVNPLMDLW